MDRETRFRSLYEQQQPDMLAYFLRRLGREDAVEATADVFLVAWRRIDIIPDEPELRPWLFGVARNVLRNRQRAGRRVLRLVSRVASVPTDPEPPPDTVVVRRTEVDEVARALQGMRPRDREVIRLRLWEEASYDEIASVLQCSRHAAEQRYAKALRRLQSVCHLAGHVGTDKSHPALQPQEQSREK